MKLFFQRLLIVIFCILYSPMLIILFLTTSPEDEFEREFINAIKEGWNSTP